MRIDVVDAAKDGIAPSQTLSRWDPRDTESGSDKSPGLESSEESDSELESNSPWSETGSETGSNQNSPSRPSSPISSTAYPPGLGGGMASHDPTADGGQLHLLAEANPLSEDDSPPHQTPTEVSSDATSPGHAMPLWLFDDPRPRILALPALSPMDPNPSEAGSDSTGSGATGSQSTSSKSTSSKSTSSKSTGSGSTGSDSTSSGSTDSDDAMPESETFVSKLLNGRIRVRASGSRTVNGAQRELQDALDSRVCVPLSSLPYQPSIISSQTF